MSLRVIVIILVYTKFNQDVYLVEVYIIIHCTYFIIYIIVYKSILNLLERGFYFQK